MLRVNYTGFGWTKVLLREEHLDLSEGYSYTKKTIKPVHFKWLLDSNSGGYFYIDTAIFTSKANAYGDKYSTVIDKAVYFSRPHDAAMFALQSL